MTVKFQRQLFKKTVKKDSLGITESLDINFYKVFQKTYDKQIELRIFDSMVQDVSTRSYQKLNKHSKASRKYK